MDAENPPEIRMWWRGATGPYDQGDLLDLERNLLYMWPFKENEYCWSQDTRSSPASNLLK